MIAARLAAVAPQGGQLALLAAPAHMADVARGPNPAPAPSGALYKHITAEAQPVHTGDGVTDLAGNALLLPPVRRAPI